MADNSDHKRRVLLSEAIIRQKVQPTRVVSPDAVDRGYWQGSTPSVPRHMRMPYADDRIPIVPTAEREPESDDPQTPGWVNTNCPPWVCPPFWSASIDLRQEACLPFYEQTQLIGCYEVPQDYVLVVRNISYEALNAAQGDVFRFEFYIDSSFVMAIEDKVVDATAPNPAHKYALGGNTRMLQTHLVVDRNRTLCVRGILNGVVNFEGVSVHAPGDPIITGDCTFNVYMQGFLANLRENIDGGPRPTDLGDGDGEFLELTQEYGGYHE